MSDPRDDPNYDPRDQPGYWRGSGPGPYRSSMDTTAIGSRLCPACRKIRSGINARCRSCGYAPHMDGGASTGRGSHFRSRS